MDEIKSPKSDVGKKQVILTETANIRIKEMIVEALKINKSKDILAKEINSYINELAEQLNDYPHLKTLFINGLKASTQRWFTYYSENIKFVTSLAITQLSKAGIPVKDISVSWSSADKFRPYVSNNPKGLPIIENYQKKVKQQLTSLIHDNPTGVILDKDNKPRKVSLRNYAEREVRFEANKNDIESLKKKGVKLVITTTHADCSERCKPWQGEIFSLDGTSGVIDSKRYQPLENAMKGVNGDGNGIISGYNCRHRAIPYKSGMVLPTEYTEAEIKRERAIDQEQRYRERTIRNLKVQERLLRANGDIELAKKVRLKWREKQTEYKVFSLENGRSYEEWRCRISNDEKDTIIQSDSIVQDYENEKVLNKYTDNGKLKLVTKGGIELREIGDHFKYRQTDRSVNLDDALDALTNPLKYGKEKIDSKGRKSIEYIGERATAYINPDTGKLITTHKTHRRLVEKLKGGDNNA